MRRLILTLLFVPLVLQACGGGHDTSDALTLGTHKVSVSPRCVTKQINNRFPDGEAIYNLSCGDTRVTIRNEELMVNEKTYGELGKGDAIHVEDGVVFINGKQIEEGAKR